MSELLVLTDAPGCETLGRAVRCEAAGGVFHSVRRAGGWAELSAWAAAGSGARLAFVDPYHGARGLAAAEIARLRERSPGLEVVALADLARCSAADAFALARLGVREAICTSQPDAAARVGAALAAHPGRGPMEEVVDSLSGRVPAGVGRWLGPVLLSAGGVRTVTEMARAARCSPRTLRRTVQDAGLPAPEELLAWRRLLHAGRLLDDGRSADSVARVLEFSTGSALRKSLRLRTGLRPGDLRRSGGLRTIARLFLLRCSAHAATPRPAPARRAVSMTAVPCS